MPRPEPALVTEPPDPAAGLPPEPSRRTAVELAAERVAARPTSSGWLGIAAPNVGIRRKRDARSKTRPGCKNAPRGAPRGNSPPDGQLAPPMTDENLLTCLRHAGIETDGYTLHELRATALDNPLLFTDAELTDLRTAHNTAELDLGRIVFLPNLAGSPYMLAPPRSYLGRAARKAWIAQLSAWVTFFCDEAPSNADVFDAWQRHSVAQLEAARESGQVARERELAEALGLKPSSPMPSAFTWERMIGYVRTLAEHDAAHRREVERLTSTPPTAVCWCASTLTNPNCPMHGAGQPRELVERGDPMPSNTGAVAVTSTEALTALLLVNSIALGQTPTDALRHGKLDCMPRAQALGETSNGWRADAMLRRLYAALSDAHRELVDGDLVGFPSPIWEMMTGSVVSQ